MIYYACLWWVLGVGIATTVVATKWFWLLQGLFLLFSRYFFMAVLAVLLGMNYFAWRYHALTERSLPVLWIQRPLSIEGAVISIPKVTAHAQQFLFKIDKPYSYIVRLSWYNTNESVQYADHWRLTVSLKPPLGLHNPGGFDYGAWLLIHGIQGSGYIRSYPGAVLLHRENSLNITRWRQSLQNQISQHLAHQEIAGLIAALTIGSHDLIQNAQWTIFQRTGTNHLIAISGLHIGFAAGFGFLLAGFLWRRSQRLMLWRPVQDAQAMTGIVFALLYGLMAGFSLPTQRAVIMLIVMMSTALIKEEVSLWMRLVFAFCLVVICDPFVLYSSSLWMSFGSVMWIAYVCSGRWKSYSRMMQWWRLQLALFIGLAPLTLFYYHQVSIVGMVANALAVPWVGFVIVPICLLAAMTSCFIPSVSNLLFVLAGQCITPLWYYLEWLSHQPWAVWVHVIPSDWILIFSLMAAGLLLLPRGMPGRWFGLFLALPLFFYRPAGPANGQVWLTTLSVGQGLSAVIRTAHHVLLYDAGPKSYSGFDAGAAVVVPYLQYMGINHLNMMMISHGDNDHIGGAFSVLQAITTEQVLTSVPWKLRSDATFCFMGQRWQWDGVLFQVLWPPKGQPYADNNSSCVLRITDGAAHILLTGDIEASTEQWLLENESTLLPATIIVAPHHGSRSSSTEPFVRAVHPVLVIFPTGAYNRFHFPAAEIVARYRNIQAQLYNTATDGAITVQMSPNAIQKIEMTRRKAEKLL